MTPALVDQAARDRIRDALDESLCVEAGAGTGKTTALVSRVVNVLRSGRVTVDELAVITFTDAAAAELAGRVREGLEQALEDATDNTERERIHEALSGLHRAHIETIHAFCGSLLRERPVEAGLDPGFEVADELTERLRLDAAYAAWQSELLAGDCAAVKMATNRGFGREGIRDLVDVVNRFRELIPLDLPAVVPADVDGFVYGYHEVADQLRDLVDRAANDPKASTQIERILRFDDLLREAVDDREWLEREILWGAPKVRLTAGAQRYWEDANDCRETKELFRKLREATDEIQPAMRTEALVGVLPLAQEFVRAQESARRAEGLATFDDLLNWSRDLLRDSPEAREYFRKRFRVLLVDEFQDTDPVQAEIALLISSDDEPGENLLDLHPRPGALTAVGDPKQSIYRFRRADIAVYDAVRTGPLAGKPPQLVQNFRSTSGVIAWVNDVFDRVLVREEGVQPGNVPLVASGGKLADESRSVCVVRAEPAETAEVAGANEAFLIAASIRRAVDEGWPVRDGDAERPAQWRDVAILLPARTGLDLFEDALRRSGVPYRVEAGRSFFARQEVRDLSAVLAAIDDPLDQVSLVAALRSAALGCSDEDLYLHVARGGRLDYRSDASDSPVAVRDAFEALNELHRRRASVSLARLVRETVERLRLIEIALAGWDGQQAAANLAKLVEQSRAFSSSGGGGLRAFARWLSEQMGSHEVEDAGIAEPTDDAVRIVTMHSSKGLEYPIVALANLGAAAGGRVEPVADRAASRLHVRISSGKQPFATPDFGSVWQAEKAQLDAEDLRLLYVAATRARDRLIIPVSFKKDPGRRLEAFLPSLPPEDAPPETTTDGCFVLDPERLPPLAEDEPPAASPPPAREVEAELAAREAWEAARNSMFDAATAELAVHPATRDEGDMPISAVLLGVEDVPLIAGESGPPAAKGEAMHRILELVDLHDPHDLEEVARSVCTVAGLDEHVDEILELCRACLESDALARALRSDRLWREVPYTVKVEDGYATGRIDLMFEEGGELVAIDWKSDSVGPGQVAEAAERHRGQAEAYAQALAVSTGMRVKEVLFVFARAEAAVGALDCLA